MIGVRRILTGAFAGLIAAQLSAQANLKIVVIEGEDGVNIIQQKTAVRPVIEVRDRNNLPVSGALVTFSIEGGKAASFGGASTLTVATNAAGQAAVTSLTPATAGAFQIQVSAAFQGQVATATIAQTNVLTAAQAAAAGAATSGGSAGSAGGGGAGGASAGGAGGAAGGAGGLSATTIAVAGAAVAGGAVAAQQIASKDEEGSKTTSPFTGPFSGQISSTVASRAFNSSCVITRAINGTATLTFEGDTTTSVRGRIEMSGTDTLVAQSCGQQNNNTNFTGVISVSGTPAAIRGSDTRTDSQRQSTGEVIDATTTIGFEGSLNGNTVTGTIKFDQKSISSGGAGGIVDQMAVGTFPVTMTRQ